MLGGQASAPFVLPTLQVQCCNLDNLTSDLLQYLISTL